jgi:3',5'-cyclic AMP phosphodiesterase CpdA
MKPTTQSPEAAPQGVDPTRRTLLKCMAWAGTGLMWTVSGGVPRAMQLGGTAFATPRAVADFTFVQVSDSHIGFKNAPNSDPAATLREVIDRIGQMSDRPALLIHTGDVSHLSKPDQFDAADQIVRRAGLDTYYVPGEHDVLIDDGKSFFERFGRERGTGGWYSFDQGGVHFVGLVNVIDLKPGGLGRLGAAQLEWLEDDLKGRSASTPIVVFTHMPLWLVYQDWGWGTEDGPQALSYLKRFGSVTVLNGHIHQVVQKVEGSVTFYTARSTAYPQPAPGTAAGPGPLKVPSDRLRSFLGLRSVSYVHGQDRPAIADTPLGA